LFSKGFYRSICPSVSSADRARTVFDDGFPLLARALVTKHLFSGAQDFCGAGLPTLEQSPPDLVQIVSQYS